MKDFTFAVSRIRELENGLLSRDMLEQLISAKNEREILSVFPLSGENKSAEDIFKEQKLTAWQEVNSLAQNSTEIKSLTVMNDFHNLKAALKSLVTGKRPERLYLFPTVIDTQNFYESIRDKRFYDMPSYIGETAERGYSVLTETKNGQLFDSYVDRETLKTLKSLGEESDSEMFRECTEFFINMTNIKTAYSCSLSGKSESFLLDSLCQTQSLDIYSLASESSRGEQALLSFLETSVYSKAASKIKASPIEFEKFIDDKISEIMKDKARDFSIDPILSYYYAKLTDIKNLRIIFICKKHSVKPENIRERLRKTYV